MTLLLKGEMNCLLQLRTVTVGEVGGLAPRVDLVADHDPPRRLLLILLVHFPLLLVESSVSEPRNPNGSQSRGELLINAGGRESVPTAWNHANYVLAGQDAFSPLRLCLVLS